MGAIACEKRKAGVRPSDTKFGIGPSKAKLFVGNGRDGFLASHFALLGAADRYRVADDGLAELGDLCSAGYGEDGKERD